MTQISKASIIPGWIRQGTEESENGSHLAQSCSVLGDNHQAILAFCERREGKEGERREEERRNLGEKKRERKMRVGLKVGENDSEELISHSSKEAHN